MYLRGGKKISIILYFYTDKIIIEKDDIYYFFSLKVKIWSYLTLKPVWSNSKLIQHRQCFGFFPIGPSNSQKNGKFNKIFFCKDKARISNYGGPIMIVTYSNIVDAV